MQYTCVKITRGGENTVSEAPSKICDINSLKRDSLIRHGAKPFQDGLSPSPS